jgi:hypothetical protein
MTEVDFQPISESVNGEEMPRLGGNLFHVWHSFTID